MKNAKIVKVTDIEGKPPRSAGGGGIWRRLIGSEDTESGMLLGFGVIKPGESRGWHSHPPGEDEIFFVMEGRALAEWIFEGKTYREEVSAGTAFYTPGDMENNISNTGESDLRAVYCIARSAPLLP